MHEIHDLPETEERRTPRFETERETHFDRFPEFLVLASFQVLRHLAGIAHRLGLGLQQQLSDRSISAGW